MKISTGAGKSLYATETLEVTREFRLMGKRGVSPMMWVRKKAIVNGERRQFDATIYNPKTIKELVDRINTMDHGPRLEAIICQAAGI